MGTMNLSSHFRKDVYSMISSSSFGRKLANNTKTYNFAITFLNYFISKHDPSQNKFQVWEYIFLHITTHLIKKSNQIILEMWPKNITETIFTNKRNVQIAHFLTWETLKKYCGTITTIDTEILAYKIKIVECVFLLMGFCPNSNGFV